MQTGILYSWILGFFGIFISWTFWQGYLGNGEWYYSKKSILTLLIISALAFFNLGSSYGITIASPLVFGIKTAVILAIGQLYVVYLIWTRQI
jgi:hypothetical protein